MKEWSGPMPRSSQPRPDPGGTPVLRGRFAWWICLVVACALVLGAWEGRAGSAGSAAGRPNVLVLVADDQRWDQLSCADQPVIPELRTPHIDSLAAQGVFFRNAFITTPICAVSRASIMTGRYVSTHGMNHFRTPLEPEVMRRTYPAVLKEHGYRTGLLGKWGMGDEGAREHFDVFHAWTGQGNYFHQTEEGRIHNSEWLARRAREFMEESPKDQPFCLTICYKAPHHPYQPDERDANLFADARIPRRSSDTAAAYAALPGHIMDGSLNRWCYFDERKDEATREKFEKDFLRCVASLDRSVGEVLRSLRALGLEDNTVVLYLSDHGYIWGERGLGGKWLLYEESIRVPLIIRAPGAPGAMRGARLDQMALNIDVAPTLLDLAGVPIPAEMDGLSLKPLIFGKEAPSREHFFLEHVGVIKTRNPIPDSRGVRARNWKYIRYVNADPEVEELYNLADDPGELRNLANDEASEATLKDLRKIYADYLESLRPGRR